MKRKCRYRRFGALIYKRRLEMNLTQEQLAELLQLSVQQVRNYESGRCRPSLVRVVFLSSKMELPVDSLVQSFSHVF